MGSQLSWGTALERSLGLTEASLPYRYEKEFEGVQDVFELQVSISAPPPLVPATVNTRHR